MNLDGFLIEFLSGFSINMGSIALSVNGDDEIFLGNEGVVKISVLSKNISSYYTIGGGAKIFKNFFLEMTPLGVKIYGESEVDVFEAKKRFPDPGKACVFKRKVAKNFSKNYLKGASTPIPYPSKKFFFTTHVKIAIF
jgi:hypothetical protein